MNNCKFLYFIIPTVNGEIDDDPIIFVSNKILNKVLETEIPKEVYDSLYELIK